MKITLLIIKASNMSSFAMFYHIRVLFDYDLMIKNGMLIVSLLVRN